MSKASIPEPKRVICVDLEAKTDLVAIRLLYTPVNLLEGWRLTDAWWRWIIFKALSSCCSEVLEEWDLWLLN